MISILSSKAAPSKVVDGVTKSREVLCLVGLSSDTKPTTSYRGILICNGSLYDEIDTGKEYLYDEAGGEWHEQPDGDKKKDDPTAEDISVSRGAADAGKVIVVGEDGKLLPVNLDSTGEVAIDRTLSVSGAAADAKKVGDALSAVNGSLENKADLPITSKNIEVTWDAEHDGNYIDGNGNIGISELFHISDLIEVDAHSVYVLDFTYPESAIAETRIHAYDSEGAWISQVAYRLNSYRNIISFITDSKTRYIRVSVRKTATVNYFRRALESAYCFDASYTVTMKDGATYLVDPAENSVTITSNKSSKYQSANTMTDFAGVKLEAGSLYEWHYKANVVSGSPTILMALRDSNDSIVVSLSGSDGKESSGYFIAKKEMRYLSLFCSFSTAIAATVKYSDVWIKKVESGKEKINLIRQSKYGDSNSILQIVHFSDIHGDTVAMDAITEFLNKYHVDDVINTGDICYFTYGYGELVDDEIVTVKEYDTSKSYNIDDVCIYNNLLYVCTTATSGDFTSSHWRKVNTGVSAWSLSSKDLYLNHPIAERALTVLGNHETLLYVYNKATGKVSATNNWYVLNRQEAYETFFEPFISGWGVTHQSQRLYWHKDYASVGIRIIGIDMQYWDAEEESWLGTVLAEAQSLGYKVILLSHYILGQFTGNPDVTFQYNTTDDQIYTGNYKSSSSGYYGAYRNGDAISTLVNYRDIIICNLCGHMHADYYGYTKLDDTDGRQLLTIGIDQAGILREVSGADRSAADTRYVFNLFTVDTSTKVLKIVRFGNDTDKYLRSKKTLCVRYETGEVLANN